MSPMRTPRAAASACALVGLLAVAQVALPLPGGRPQPVRAAAPTTAPDEVTASAAAEASGVPVEALSDRTEYEQVFANPDGSFTYHAAVTPQRVQLADGTWSAADATLRRNADGP